MMHLSLTLSLVASCFHISTLRMDNDHYWAEWRNGCRTTIDVVYAVVRFDDERRSTGIVALYFIPSGVGRVTRFSVPRGVGDYRRVVVERIAWRLEDALEMVK